MSEIQHGRQAVSSDTRAMMAFESAKKSVGVGYLLWFFLGGLGVHRFYLGKTTSAIVLLCLSVTSLLLTLVYVGFFGLIIVGIWLLVDLFLIPGMARDYNQALTQRITAGFAE